MRFPVLPVNSVPPVYAQLGRNRRKVNEFNTTLNEDHAIAALASTGDSRIPVKGYSAPAATGMPRSVT
jgi:hypothetical protein